MSFAACGRDAGLKGPTGRTAQRSKPSPRFFRSAVRGFTTRVQRKNPGAGWPRGSRLI